MLPRLLDWLGHRHHGLPVVDWCLVWLAHLHLNQGAFLDKMLVVVGDDGDAEMPILTEKWGPLNLGAHSV